MQNFFTSVLIITSSKRKSSSSGMFYKIGVLKIFTKFTGKHLYGSLFLEACNFVKQNSGTDVFLCFCKILENIYFIEHLRTAASKKGNINSINTVRSLSKIWVFCTEELVFWFLNIYNKKKYKLIQIFVQFIKRDENKASDRTFIQGYSETLSYSNFFILWSPYCLKHLISRIVYTLNN